MTTSTTQLTPEQLARMRPSLTLYHASPRGTGGAMKMDLHPAHDVKDGCIMMSIARQKTVGNPSAQSFATFDWENRIVVKLDFSDLCHILQVLRGECETVGEGHGLFHRSVNYATKIVFRHVLEPKAGYLLEVYRSTIGRDDQDVNARIFLSPSEALGISVAIENSLGVICFGIPKVIPHDTSAYEAALKERRNESAA